MLLVFDLANNAQHVLQAGHALGELLVPQKHNAREVTFVLQAQSYQMQMLARLELGPTTLIYSRHLNAPLALRVSFVRVVFLM